MTYLHKSLEIEPKFMTVHLYMKLGEANYKLDKCDVALDYFRKALKAIQPKEDYLIELFIAKCLDKMKLFKAATNSYQNTLALYEKEPEQD